MRRKDENKKEAIFEATISLLNEIGFYQISMSKIAKRAGVSSATIYVYFEDKDDMIRKLYLDCKAKLSSFVINDLDDKKPVQHIIEQVMRKILKFIVENKDKFLFLEQFTNSPLVENLKVQEKMEAIGVFTKFIEKGKKEGVLKKVDTGLLMNYVYYSIVQLAKSYFAGEIKLTERNIQSIINMSWDALRS
jgi:AcrR family transcriptional regulator